MSRFEVIEWWDAAQTRTKVEHHFYPSNTLSTIKKFDCDGRLHGGENDEPSVQDFYPDGRVNRECWHDHGAKHRVTRDPDTGLTLPAVIVYNERVSVRAWYRKGRRHNADRDPETGTLLPAWIVDDDDHEKKWHLASSPYGFCSPDDPDLLDLLDAWERDHGVSGCPKTKSALKGL